MLLYHKCNKMRVIMDTCESSMMVFVKFIYTVNTVELLST